MKKRKDLLPKIVFLFFITTSLVTTFSLSKYQSTGAGVNSANIANFIVEVNSLPESSKELILDCAKNYNPLPETQYKLKISNKNDKNKICQVGMEYSIVVKLPSALPEGVSLSVSDSENVVISENNTVYTYKSKNVFSPGVEQEYTNILTFSASEDLIGYHTLNDISIEVITKQID